jgi:tape measure domain-containing protein
MAGKKLTWVFELFDRMSKPSKAISTHLDELDRRAHKAAEATDRLTGRTAKTGGAADRLTEKMRRVSGETKRFGEHSRRTGDAARAAGDGFGWFGLKLTGWLYALRTAGSLLSGVAGGVMGLGGAFLKAGVDAANFRESTGMGLEVLLGSKPKADALLSAGVKFAGKTPFTTKDTMRWIQDLTAAGFTDNRLWEALSAAGDVGALRGFDPQVIDRVITVFRQVKGKGKLQAEELMQLAEAGIPIGKVWDTIGKKVGISGAELQTPKYAGRVSADLGIWGILETIRTNFSGGTLGGLMDKQSGTAAGLLSTLESRPFEWMMDLDKSPGFQSFKKALKNLVDVLDPETPAGKRIKANVERLFNGIMGGLFKRFEDPAAVEAWVNSMVDGFSKLIPRAEQLAAKLGNMAESLTRIANLVNGMSGGWGEQLFRWLHNEQSPNEYKERRFREYMGWMSMPKLGLEREAPRIFEKEAFERGWTLPSIPLANRPSDYRPYEPPRPRGGSVQQVIVQPGALPITVQGASNPTSVADEVKDTVAQFLEDLAAGTGMSPQPDPAGG